MLGRVIYAGYIDLKRWNLAPIKGQHEPLISFESYLKNQELLQETSKAPIRIDTNREFPLRGMVACGDCGSAYTACFAKGRNTHYPYYLCNQKGCDSYGKSIRRDVLEGEFESILADMQPSKDIIVTASKMFRMAWEMRLNNSKVLKQSVEKEIKAADSTIEQLLDRIVNSTNMSVVSAYEKRIENLEKQKLLLAEKLTQTGTPMMGFDKAFRTAMLFLSNPHAIWSQGGFEEKMMVVRMAFSEKLEYVRNQGFRTAQKALPFSFIEGFSTLESEMVGQGGKLTTDKPLIYSIT
ncbi:MAG: zinc ribbon domain-containing protein [Rickettsiales bacterium]|nr:zinc ribbon domain-containing protein [Rickettsiales bacterium]